MKRSLLLLLLAAAVAMSAGCANRAWTPASMSVASSYHGEPTATSQAPPTAVYRDGRWLTYRNDGYYYHNGAGWVAYPVPGYPYYGRRGHRPSRGWGAPAPPRTSPAPAPADDGYTIYRR